MYNLNCKNGKNDLYTVGKTEYCQHIIIITMLEDVKCSP